MSSRHWTAIDDATEAACLAASAAVHAEAERLLLVVDEAHTAVRAVIHPAAQALRNEPPNV
jgi:hypothetical protein